MAAVANEIERGHAAVIAGDCLAVDDAGARAKAGQRLDDQREATSEVIAGTAVEPHLLAVIAGNDAKAVSHWLPEGSLSVLLGRHGAMNPAGRVRCNMPDK